MRFSALVLLFVAVCAKDLHIKETNKETVKNDELNFLDFYHYDDNVYTEKERYARHLELVTESVLEHLLTEIKNKYSKNVNQSESNIPKLVKRLKMKLRQRSKKKMKKQKRKRQRHLNSTEHDSVTEIAKK